MNRATASRITNNEIERKMNIALFDFSNEQTSPAKAIYLPKEMYEELTMIHGKKFTSYKGVDVFQWSLTVKNTEITPDIIEAQNRIVVV